jgi:hypothetical protein
LVDGQPTNKILETRRRSELSTPVPMPKRAAQQLGCAHENADFARRKAVAKRPLDGRGPGDVGGLRR